MSITRSRRAALVGAVGAGIIGTAAVSFSVAQAGHENVVLEAELSGASEVGDDGTTGVGDEDGTGHAYVFGIDDDPVTLCYVITAEGIDPTFEAEKTGMAHIHRGAEGENGPVVAALAFPLEGDAADCITEGEEGKFPLIGEDGEPESIVADILANPADYYVNVHTGEFPDGAIRGQLANVHDTMQTDGSAPTATTTAESDATTGTMTDGSDATTAGSDAPTATTTAGSDASTATTTAGSDASTATTGA